MYKQLLRINEAVGKVTLDELYSMTPREVQTLVAGGYQRNIDAITNSQFVQSATLVPTIMVDPDKFNYDEFDKQLKKMRQSVGAMTDNKIKEQLQHKKEKQQQFINLFGLAHKRGGQS